MIEASRHGTKRKNDKGKKVFNQIMFAIDSWQPTYDAVITSWINCLEKKLFKAKPKICNCLTLITTV